MDVNQESDKAATEFHTSAYGELLEAMHNNWYFLSVAMALINHTAIVIDGAVSMGKDPREALHVDPALLDRIAGGNTDTLRRLQDHVNDLPTAWDNFVENVSKEQYHRTVLEISLSRNVDAFNYYMVRILNHIFEKDPAKLSERHRNRLTGLNDEDRKAELEKIVEGMAGLTFIVKYLITHLGLLHDMTTDTFLKAKEYIAVRNLVIHNAGVVNHRNMGDLTGTSYAVGETFPLTLAFAIEGYHAFSAMVRELDSNIANQFKSIFPIAT